jgi:hypothetical protein
MLVGGMREREGREEKPFIPPPMRVPKWDSQWLVESGREEKGRRKVALLEREK